MLFHKNWFCQVNLTKTRNIFGGFLKKKNETDDREITIMTQEKKIDKTMQTNCNQESEEIDLTNDDDELIAFLKRGW